MSQSPADPLVGSRVGSFVIDRLLGQGGMGSVYVGVQPDIGKRVAVKFLADEFNANANLVQRFFQEARAVNVIGHENIVDIFDFGKTPDGRNYFVMELLEGTSLEHALVGERAFSVARVVDVGRQIARCLGAAHERGIVHRDLKPDNVFLVRRGGRADFVKVLDFGIAKLTSQGGEPGRTQTGMVLGTPGYMAPEQAGGGNVDARADVYALGVILYRALAGTIPFAGESYAQILRRQLMEEADSLRRVRADVTDALDKLVLRMLAREPVDRAQSMQEVEEVLDEVSRQRLATSVIWYTAPITDGSMAAQDSATAPLKDDARRSDARADKSNSRAQGKALPAGDLAERDRGATRDLALAEAPPRSLGRGGPSGLLIGGALCVIVGGGVAGIAVFQEPRQTAQPAPQTAAAEALPVGALVAPPVPAVVAAAAVPVVAPPAPPATPPPSRYAFHVQSEPTGAAIFDGNKKLGITPYDASLEKDVVLTVRLGGYKDEKIDARRANEGHEPVKLVLKKVVRSAEAGSAPAALPRLPRSSPAEEDPAAGATPKAKGISIDD